MKNALQRTFFVSPPPHKEKTVTGHWFMLEKPPGMAALRLCFKTRHQIAQEYGLSYPTFWRRLKYHGIELPPGLISLRGQKVIYEKMGYPPGVVAADYADPPRE